MWEEKAIYKTDIRIQPEQNDWVCTSTCKALTDKGECGHGGGLCCMSESMRIIAKLRQEKESSKPYSGWVSAKDKLPDTDDTVLAIASGKPMQNITLDNAYVMANYYRGEGWFVDEYPEWDPVNITHWMPLPDPPKEW